MLFTSVIEFALRFTLFLLFSAFDWRGFEIKYAFWEKAAYVACE